MCATRGASSDYVFKHSLQVAGMLHVFSNVLRDIDNSLVQWTSFIAHLKRIEKLVSHPDRMERFTNTCVRGTEFEREANIRLCLRRYNIMYDKRWGEVHLYCRRLDALMPLLQACWSYQKFARGLSKTTREDTDIISDSRGFAEAIQDRWFVGYMRMVLLLGDVVEQLTLWAERCPCHNRVLAKYHDSQISHMPAHVLRSECGADRALHMSTLSCPLRGCRAPELAAGEVVGVLDEAWKAALGDLIIACRGELDNVTWLGLLRDFELAKGYCVFILTSKLQVWEELPWRLCALAHVSASVARRAAVDALQMFERVSDEQLHHRVSQRFLSRGSPLRNQLEEFAKGRPMDALDHLRMAVAPLRFIPVTERSVEAPHGRIKRNITSKHHKAHACILFCLLIALLGGGVVGMG